VEVPAVERSKRNQTDYLKVKGFVHRQLPMGWRCDSARTLSGFFAFIPADCLAFSSLDGRFFAMVGFWGC
jgi:hypothetical protein